MNASTLKKLGDRLAWLAAQYEKEMDRDVPCGINPPDDVELGGISEWDGTAPRDTRPDFVKEDDARILGRDRN